MVSNGIQRPWFYSYLWAQWAHISRPELLWGGRRAHSTSRQTEAGTHAPHPLSRAALPASQFLCPPLPSPPQLPRPSRPQKSQVQTLPTSLTAPAISKYYLVVIFLIFPSQSTHFLNTYIYLKRQFPIAPINEKPASLAVRARGRRPRPGLQRGGPAPGRDDGGQEPPGHQPHGLTCPSCSHAVWYSAR